MKPEVKKNRHSLTSLQVLKLASEPPMITHRVNLLKAPLHSDLSLKEALQTLTKVHYFEKLSLSGSRSCRKVIFNNSLTKLSIQQGNNQAKFLPITGILSIESGFSKQLHKELQGDFFGFRVITVEKTWEFSSSLKLERDRWVQSAKKVLEISLTWKGSNGFQNYWQTLQQLEQYTSAISQTTQLTASHREKVNHLRKEFKYCHDLIVQDVVESMLTKLEVQELEYTNMKITYQNKRISKKYEKLRDKSDKLQIRMRAKDEEIQNLTESVQAFEHEWNSLFKIVKYSNLEELSRIWLNIIDFLTLEELLVVKLVSKFYVDIVHKQMSVKSNWKKLPFAGLQPRSISWKYYMSSFYPSNIAQTVSSVPPKLRAEIKKDVSRGLPDLHTQVEDVLVQLVALTPDVGYCQGMQQVAHFLLSRLRQPKQVLSVFLSIMRAPFYLGEVWKRGFPRLQIAIFQLEFLVKLKMPVLAKHMKQIDLKLDVIISSWLLTVFIHLNSQQGFPLHVIDTIWDYFLVKGWSSVISACLALLQMSQHSVIGESLENTIDFYTNELPFEGFHKHIASCQVESDLLNDLERAYYLQS